MTYRMKTKPYDHQREALKRSKGHDVFAFLMAMRTGKTKVDLDDFGILEDAGEVKDYLVMAPNGVYRTWEGAIRDHLPDELLDRSLIHVWETSGGVAYKRTVENFLKKKDKRRPRILLMSVEALSTVDRAREFVLEFLDQRKGKRKATVDESVVIKTPGTERTDFIVGEVGPMTDYRRILSGLPTPKSPLDLYTQFEFLDWRILGHRSFYSYRARYAVMKRVLFPGRKRPTDLVVGYRNTEELHEKIEPYSFRVPFRPKIPSTYTIREVTMTKEQARIYREVRDLATSELANKSYVTPSLVITKMLRLHQILCGHVINDEKKEIIIPENRTKQLIEILDDYEGKAVIWFSYDFDVRKVTAALTKHFGDGSVARFWGGNVKTREDEAKMFLERDKTRFMLATPDAGRFSRTWSNADLVVYYSSKANLDHRDQSEMRVMGVEKERQVDFIDLVVPGTVDMKHLRALREKINLATAITGDDYREWLI